MKWLSLEWYKYLFAKKNGNISFIRTIICRIRNHPCGVWYYNLNGTEPDMHCKDCNDNLG